MPTDGELLLDRCRHTVLIQQTIVHVDLSKLAHNVRELQKCCPATTQLMAAGDAVVTMGCQADACMTADAMAGLCGTINYEVVSSLSRRMPLQLIYTKE